MGELDTKPFQSACKQKFSAGEAAFKSAELSSIWEERIKDPHWHPFKMVIVGEEPQVCQSSSSLKYYHIFSFHHVRELILC